MNALCGFESSATNARLPALLEDIELRGCSADTIGEAAAAVALARDVNDPALLIKALFCAVESNVAGGNWQVAIALGEEMSDLCGRTKDRLGAFKARYRTADALWRDGQLTEAFIAYEQAGSIARSIGDVERQVRSLNMMAFMLGFLRDYPASLVAFDRALALCTDDRYEFDRILVVNNKAQSLVNRAREGAERDHARSYAETARSLLANGVIETIERVWPRAGLAARDTLGQALVLLGLSEQALAIFRENARRAVATRDDIYRTQAEIGMAEAWLDLGRPEDALARCHSLRGSDQIRQRPDLRPRVEYATARALSALDRHEEAYEAFARYHERLMEYNSRVAFQYMKYMEVVVQLETSRAETEAYKKLTHELTIAKQAAEDASRAKTEFLSNMSHELRTPLNAIIGFAELMRGEMFGPIQMKYRQYLDDIHGSGRRLLDLIDQLLDLSKAESGSVDLANEPVLVNDLLDDAATRIADVAAGKNVTFEWSLCVGTIVHGDRMRLAQCILNVISNALEIVPHGGQIGLTTRFERGGLAIDIAASGPGLRPDEVPTAFERFGRGGAPKAGTGTGIGLPLAKRIIELHGGTAEISSSREAGTVVTLRLPLDRLAMGPA
jgi:signal transduction histidine kinase